MAISGPIKLGTDICEALDIRADRTRSIHLAIDIADAPTVTIEQLVDDGWRVVDVLRRYQLVPMPTTRRGRFVLRMARRLAES